jgi:hypothetical protein
MRIIGGRDYYDLAMALGRDDSTVFVRRPKELPDKNVPFSVIRPPFNVWFRKGRKGRIRIPMDRGLDGYWYAPKPGRFWLFAGLSLVLCGVLYRGIRLRDKANGVTTEHFFWSDAGFQAWLDQEDVTLTWHRSHMIGSLTEVLGRQPPISRAQTDWIMVNGVVSALGIESTDITWTINGDGLKAVEFFRVLDPWSAWQEISMFVGGVLAGSGKEMVEINDSVRLQKHGFDKVRSFRNMERI